MIQGSLSASGLKFLFLSWTLSYTVTLSVRSSDITNNDLSTPSPSDSWHELQDQLNQESSSHVESYFWDVGQVLWSWVKEHKSIPKDYETFQAQTYHFYAIDVNGDQKVDGLELIWYLHHNSMIHRNHSHEDEIMNSSYYKLTHYEKDSVFIDSLLNDADSDKDGFLDFYEYQAAATKFGHSKYPVMKKENTQDHHYHL